MKEVKLRVPPIDSEGSDEELLKARKNALKVLARVWDEEPALWIIGIVECIDMFLEIRRRKWAELWKGAGI